MTVCFKCCSPDVLPGHNVCVAHHSALMCRKCRTPFREGSGYVSRKPRKKSPKPTVHTPGVLDALAGLGGAATSKQLAAETGLTGNQVRAALEGVPTVRYRSDPNATKRSGGLWCIESDADSESTASETSEALAA